jgi:hypothetical protein
MMINATTITSRAQQHIRDIPPRSGRAELPMGDYFPDDTASDVESDISVFIAKRDCSLFSPWSRH